MAAPASIVTSAVNVQELPAARFRPVKLSVLPPGDVAAEPAPQKLAAGMLDTVVPASIAFRSSVKLTPVMVESLGFARMKDRVVV